MKYTQKYVIIQKSPIDKSWVCTFECMYYTLHISFKDKYIKIQNLTVSFNGSLQNDIIIKSNVKKWCHILRTFIILPIKKICIWCSMLICCKLDLIFIHILVQKHVALVLLSKKQLFKKSSRYPHSNTDNYMIW